MNKYFFFIFFLSLVCLASAFAQEDTAGKPDYFRENYLRYDDHIYKPNIKTVMLHRVGFELSAPVITLNSAEKLLLSFDELGGSVQKYQYTFIHCDAAWKPTPINITKVLDGYMDDYIRDFRPSTNSLQDYIHYELAFPNNNIQFLISGNYIVMVYADENMEDLVLTARFQVVEPRLKINAEVKRGNNLDELEIHQKIDFTFFAGNIALIDPYRNIDVVIRQNKRWDNAITNLKPALVRGNELDYRHDFGNTFPGGNEFRYFDTKSVKSPSENIAYIDPGTKLYEFHVRPDQRRNTKVYITEEDINGRFKIAMENGRDPSVDADYVLVYFSLKASPPFFDGSVYLMGALSRWQFTAENKMTYNYATKSYEVSFLLKQGYYNYQYVFLENGKTAGDVSRIEGSHYETENEYDIYVYYRDPAAEYERLLGWTVIASRSK
jgi:hypothetical protein